MERQPTILLVDDEAVFLEIASTKLRAKNFQTVVARDVPDAIEKAEEIQPDLVLSDVYMPPGPSGWELALALRHNPKTQNIRFAFFTSLRDPWVECKSDRAETAAVLGKISFFSKSDDVESLADKVAELLPREKWA